MGSATGRGGQGPWGESRFSGKAVMGRLTCDEGSHMQGYVLDHLCSALLPGVREV